MPAPVFLAPGPEAITAPIGVEQGITYTIIGPDGTRAVINDANDRDWVGTLSSPPTGLERAGIRENAATLPEADGGVHPGPFLYDRLSFTLTGILQPTNSIGINTSSWLTRQAKLLRATNAMRADARLLWTPSEAVPVFINFRQQQPTRITGARPKAFLVQGVAEDPFVYSQELHNAQATLSALTGGGLPSPLTSPLTSSASIAGQAIVTNVGSITSWPTLTVYGPITNPSITNFTTGKTIVFAGSLSANDHLSIDTNPRRRSAMLNDAVNFYGNYNFGLSQWWGLEPGANDLRLGATAYSAGASLVVQWRDAWG